MRLRYTFSALSDLATVLDYIAEHSPKGAAKVHARIQTLTELLLRHPHAGPCTDDPTIRRMSVTPYPYLVFYEVVGDDIIVHAVRHSARDPSGNPRSG